MAKYDREQFLVSTGDGKRPYMSGEVMVVQEIAVDFTYNYLQLCDSNTMM